MIKRNEKKIYIYQTYFELTGKTQLFFKKDLEHFFQLATMVLRNTFDLKLNAQIDLLIKWVSIFSKITFNLLANFSKARFERF